MSTSRGASRGPFHPADDNYPLPYREHDKWLIAAAKRRDGGGRPVPSAP
ncbi:MAG: hypothetical protein ACOC3I_04180 [Verrucomicrobiota bacterium]